ncbi:hypothetical protein JOM56_015524 [Amanita muscaria]
MDPLKAPLDDRPALCGSGDILVSFSSRFRILPVDSLNAPLDDRPALCGSGDIPVSLSTGAKTEQLSLHSELTFAQTLALNDGRVCTGSGFDGPATGVGGVLSSSASTSGIQDIPEYSYPAVELDSVPTPGPSSLQARLSLVPPVPQSYLSRQSTLEPIPEGKGKAKSVDLTAKSTATDTWPTGLIRSSNGFYYQNEDINEYLNNTGHDDTDAVSLGDEEDFHYDGGDYDMQD